MEANGFRHSVVEALILASPEPISGRKLVEQIDDLTVSKLGQTVAELNNRYMEMGASYRIREIAGGFQFYIVPEFTGYVEEMFSRTRKMRLTRASLETLAIIAYKQPVTKGEIEQIRGVATDGVLQNLLEKNMIIISGRAESVGKPLQYGTTAEFLKFFGLNSLSDLPKMSEIEELISANEALEQPELVLEEDAASGEQSLRVSIAEAADMAREKLPLDELLDNAIFVRADDRSSADSDSDDLPEAELADDENSDQQSSESESDGNSDEEVEEKAAMTADIDRN